MIEHRFAERWPGTRLASLTASLWSRLSTRYLPVASTMRLREPATAVPWGYGDAMAVIGWTFLLATGAAISVIVVRLLVSLVCLMGEMTWLLPEGAYERLSQGFSPYGTALTALVVGGGMYASLVYAVYRRSIWRYGAGWQSLGLVRLPGAIYGRLALLFIPATLAGVAINWFVRAELGITQEGSHLVLVSEGMTATSANFAMLSLLLIGLAPVAEELFFRGFLFKLLRGQLPAWATIAITAAAFAASHASISMFPWLFFMGIVFGLAVEKTGSLYAGIMLHAMVNSLAMVSVVVALSGW
jgi:membrane protease YdiL (CAAX protease family)